MTDSEKARTISVNDYLTDDDMKLCPSESDKIRINSYHSAIEMAKWKDEQFWSYENIERIIMTYKSFPNRSCPHTIIKMTIEKLKPKQ